MDIADVADSLRKMEQDGRRNVVRQIADHAQAAAQRRKIEFERVTLVYGQGLLREFLPEPGNDVTIDLDGFDSSLVPATGEFAPPTGGRLALRVFDVLGRRVAVVEKSVGSAGSWSERLELGEGTGLRSGLYLARLTLTGDAGGEQTVTRKFIVTR